MVNHGEVVGQSRLIASVGPSQIRGETFVVTERGSLARFVGVSTMAVWIASLLCFHLLHFHDGVLLRALGPVWTYPLVGSAYPVVAGVPLAHLVSSRRPGLFVIVFGVLFFAAVGLMMAVMRLVPGVAGGYLAGVVAMSCLGTGMSCYLGQRARSIVIGLLLSCWTFLGDYMGYNLRYAIGGLLGTVIYATSYGAFLGSGLGAMLWYTTVHGARGTGDAPKRG